MACVRSQLSAWDFLGASAVQRFHTYLRTLLSPPFNPVESTIRQGPYADTDSNEPWDLAHKTRAVISAMKPMHTYRHAQLVDNNSFFLVVVGFAQLVWIAYYLLSRLIKLIVIVDLVVINFVNCRNGSNFESKLFTTNWSWIQPMTPKSQVEQFQNHKT